MDLAQKPVYKLDLAAGTSVVNLTTPLVEGDDRAQTFTLELTDKGAPANLDGYSVTAYFGRGKTAEAEADTIPLSGTVSGNVATITLTESCYSRSCYFSMPIRLSNGATGQKRTYLIVRGTVVKSVDGTIIDPDGSVPSLDDIFAQIAVMERSRQAAEEATDEALAAAARADEAREKIQGDLATLSEEIADTRNTSAWWKEGDPTYNALDFDHRKALYAIADIRVKCHIKGKRFYLYGITIDTDGNYNVKMRNTATKNSIEETRLIVLPASETFTTKEYDFGLGVITFYYRTNGMNDYRILGDTDTIELRNVEYTNNPLTDNNGDIDSRVFPKCVINPNVTAITVLRTQNVDNSATGSYYDYYAQYEVTYRNGAIKTFTSASADGVKSGVVVDEFEDFAVYCNADALAMHSTRYATTNISLNLVYADSTDIAWKLSSFKNNLTNDGVKSLPRCDIYKNKVASAENYGKDDVRYHFSLAPFKKLHLYFDYQFTRPLTAVTDDTQIQMFSVGGYAITGLIIRQAISCASGYVFQNASVGADCLGIGRGSLICQPPIHKPYNGKNAFWVRYKGDVSVASNQNIVLSVTSTEITVKHSGGTILETITYTSTDTVDSLLSKIAHSDYMECGFVNSSGHTCGELLIPDENISLVYEFANDGGETYIDAPRIYIPYATDNNWHSIEAIVDIDNQKTYVAFDGLTYESDIVADRITTYDLNIGGGQYNASETPIRIRNLEVNIDSFGDVEIVKSIAPPYSARTQLISSHNPKLLIYEGHGVDVRQDSDPISEGSDSMAISTDRLNVLFESLVSKGYVPVNWNDVIDWKVNRKPLPKRCFVTMFDDYYFDNYVEYEKRLPFEKYNVKAGLAIVSGNKDLDDTMEINGRTYTISKVVDMVMKSGWYPCSHTATHRLIINDKPSELPALLKADALSCNDLGIYSDIIVYPQGLMDNRCLSALEESAFQLGVNIVTDRYNCAATHDMNLTRVELGTRNTLEDVLATIV